MKKEDKNWMDMRSRFRVLAGIIKKDTLATLTIPNGSTIVELKTLPTWFEKLKYKLCGFECKIVREKPSTFTDFNEANKTLNRNIPAVPPNDENMTEENLDSMVRELELEAEAGK